MQQCKKRIPESLVTNARDKVSEQIANWLKQNTQGKNMNKNILFLVTGMTPQIITETIWALACDPSREEKWIPDEVHVMSTEHGLNQIRQRLIKDGNFQKLITDYQLPEIIFNASTMHSINDAESIPLEDLKSPEDNELAGDAICAKVREFTQQDNVSLHVSIAGGRKTMGFYAGYALSLYGRAQDRMSHVLVEDKYEAAINFFYPTPDETEFSITRDQKVIGPSKNAKIWLANIPFVRLRGSLPSSGLVQNAKFSEVVEAINLANQPASIKLIRKKRTLTLGDKVIKLPPREYAFYQWFAELALEEKGIIEAIVEGEQRDIPRLLELWKDDKYKNLINSINIEEFTFDKAFFEQRVSRIKSLLVKELGHDFAKLITIQLKDGPGSGYSLPLKPNQIEIINF